MGGGHQGGAGTGGGKARGCTRGAHGILSGRSGLAPGWPLHCSTRHRDGKDQSACELSEGRSEPHAPLPSPPSLLEVRCAVLQVLSAL